jgi:hypothetical protein
MPAATPMPLADHLALQQDLPDEIAHTPDNRLNGEFRVILRGGDGAPDLAEAPPK